MIIPQITYPFFSLVLVSRIYSNCLFLLLSTPTPPQLILAQQEATNPPTSILITSLWSLSAS